MKIEELFNRDCETIFQKHKLSLEHKTHFSAKNNLLEFDDYPIFSEIFASLQMDFAEKVSEYRSSIQDSAIHQTLEPLAQSHTFAFLNMIALPKRRNAFSFKQPF